MARKINVTSAFDVNMPDGRQHHVRAGESMVPDDVAEHWFVKAHMVGTPRGRMPLVEGPDGLMIEADEAGQKVQAARLYHDPALAPTRQEGPVEWANKHPAAQAAAAAAAEETGTDASDAVDGNEAEIERASARKRASKA